MAHDINVSEEEERSHMERSKEAIMKSSSFSTDVAASAILELKE